MQKGELVIRTRREADEVVHQFIPRVKLKGDFPTHIVENHLHWLDVASGNLEMRDAENLWPEKKLQSWFVSSLDNVLELGKSERLLDIRSPTTSMISSILKPLEFGEFIDVRYASGARGVSAHLPRLNLEFFINQSEELECRQFPGMVVDRDQNIGTLVGLENRLVVHQSSVRSVIIPYGEIHFETCDNHIRVRIDTMGLQKVKYHIYTIDARLGRLVGNGSLASNLYKTFLHAITSYCLPDPLTRGEGTYEALAGRTGTEEALAGLRAAATWSFQTLDNEGVEANLLKLISSLTPRRIYYPEHLKVMQTVKWNCLSPISQHDEFYSIVSSIFAHASRFHVFREGSKGSEISTYSKETSDRHLLDRAAVRNARYRTEEFGGSLVTDSKDSTYSSRDAVQDCKDEAQVWYISEMVVRWPSRMKICSQLMDVLEGWGELRGAHGGLELGYDQTWLTQDLADVWCELYKSLQESTQKSHTYQLIFLFSTLSYSGNVDLELIETLLAFASVSQFRHLALPTYSSYNLKQGFSPNRDNLLAVVRGCTKDFGGSEEANLSSRYDESTSDLARRRYQTYEENSESQSISFVDNLISEWPCATPSSQGRDYRLLNIPTAIVGVTPLFESWYRNKVFKDHLGKIQSVLNGINCEENECPQTYSFEPCGNSQCSVPSTIRLKDLLGRDPPALERYKPAPVDSSRQNTPALIGPSATAISPQDLPRVNNWLARRIRNAAKTFRRSKYSKPVPSDSNNEPTPEPLTTGHQLKLLLQEFQSRSITGFGKLYAQDLIESFEALESQGVSTGNEDPPASSLTEIKNECQKYLDSIFGIILQCLMPVGQGELMTYRAGLWPRISPMSLLQLLSGNGSVGLPLGWKLALVTYGEAITMLQRSERLLSHDTKAGGGGYSDFTKEVENTGHQQWDPMQNPDWLLIEIENNFLVRPVQVGIASKMISPPSNKNTVMQLFMGEGKTSVIVPIVAAALADGKRLVRVVVLKPLSGQMFQMLVQKLGGLVNRRIFYMPFSRAVKINQERASAIRLLYEECLQSGGILLIQPEHMLSFKLVGLEWLYNSTDNKKVDQNKGDGAGEGEIAKTLLDTQRWLEKNSRDILDESDEIMNIRNELIYTIGSSKHVENHPDRWSIVQEIFNLIRDRLSDGGFGPRDLEIETPHDRPGCFPFMRILDHGAGEKLLGDITSRIIAGNVPAFPTFFSG